MADVVQLDPDGSGKKIAAVKINDGVQDRYLQEVVVRKPDGTAIAEASVRTVDSIAATEDGKGIVIDGVVYPVLRAYVGATASAELIPLHASKKNRIVAAFLNNGSSTADGTLQFKSGGTGGTALGGPLEVRIGGGMVLPVNPYGWYENASVGENIFGAISSIGQLSGVLLYIQV